MPLESRVTHWNRTARLLHWGTVLAILIEVLAGFAMAWTYGAKGESAAAVHLRASQAHHTLGLLLLGVVAIRLIWRLSHPSPPLPQGTSAAQKLAARGVQALLYALLLALPLTGWAALSSMAAGAGYPAPEMWFFGHDGFGQGGVIPHIVTPKPWNSQGLLTYGTFARAHVWLLIGGAGVLAAHVAGALWHHFVKRNGVLARMIGG